MNRTSIAVALAGLLVTGGVQAQATPAARPTPKSPGLTDAEKLAKASESIARMKAALKAVLARVEEARNEKDVVKLNCVNEKLTQIKGLLKVAEQADVALHEAVANKHPGRDTEFAKIGIARGKIEGLRGESDQCVGQLAYVVDERTTVEVVQPEGMPERDLTMRTSPPPVVAAPPVVRRPPDASPY